MRQYMAMMQQAMGMHTMNGSSSRQKKNSSSSKSSNLPSALQKFKTSINSFKTSRDSGLSMASGSEGEFGGLSLGGAGMDLGKPSSLKTRYPDSDDE